MSRLEMSEDEKKKILVKHKEAIKESNDKKEELKKGVSLPEKKEK